MASYLEPSLLFHDAVARSEIVAAEDVATIGRVKAACGQPRQVIGSTSVNVPLPRSTTTAWVFDDELLPLSASVAVM